MFIKKGEDVYRAEIEPAAPDASNADPEYSKGVQALTTKAVNRKYLMTRRFAIREVETAQERRQNQKKQKNKN